MFDAKFFTLLTFIIINFLIIFAAKTRTTTVISLIIAHLVAIVFFSLSISNYNSFKEIVLALVVYSMVILFLISNYSLEELIDEKELKFRRSFSFIAVAFLGFFLLSGIFYSVFLIAENVTKISEKVREEKFSKQGEIFKNPMILPSHPVHIAVKRFYLGKKFEDDWLSKETASLAMNQKKRARLKDKLSDNFLFKRSSDVILIIVAISTSLLLLSRKKVKNIL